MGLQTFQINLKYLSSMNSDNNNKIQDSLDNLSNAKLRQSSLQQHRSQLSQVKHKFVSLLQKLQSSQTRQISLSQIKKLIEHNCESDHLKLYLSTMKTLKPNHNSATKQHQVLVISILTHQFRHNLVDTTDKQPDLLKTCFRVVQILLNFFNDNSTTVQQACARVLLDLNQFCLADGKYAKEQKFSLLFTPLISILRNGVDKASQATATVCINQLVKFWYSHHASQYLDVISKQVFQIILKLHSEYHEIFNATIILIQHKGLSFFENRLPNFIAKILPIINGTRETANNLNSYMCRVNVCKIIQKIAILISSQDRQKLTDLNVIGSLQKATRNKIIQVQMSAARALKAWKGQPMQQSKIQKNSISKGKPFKSLQEMRDEKKRQRSKSKQNTIKIQKQLNYMKEDLQKMVKGGWGANNRAKNYVKRGTGVGGGYYGQIQNQTPPKNNKSHRQHLQQLRDIIKKGSRQNKNLDKFDIHQEMQKYNSQIPTTSNNNVNVFVQQSKRQQKQEYNKDDLVTFEKKTSNNAGKRKIIDQYDQFQVIEQSGDQGVNLKPNYAKKPEKNYQNHKLTQNEKIASKSQNQKQVTVQDLIVTPEEAQQLLGRQQSLKNYQTNFNLKFNTQNNGQQISRKPSQIRDQKFIQRASRIKSNLNQIAPQISAQELQQLMLQNNLSEVSQNMQNFLNESDLHFQESQKPLVNQAQIVLNDPYKDFQKYVVKQDKNNFMRKGTESLKPDRKLQDSLNYTDSRVTRLKDSIAQKGVTSHHLSAIKVNEPLQQQFTLNPHNQRQSAQRFQSIQKGAQNQSEQQIEQDLVQSGYEQSYPHEKSMLPLKTKIVSRNTMPSNIQKGQQKYSNNSKAKEKQPNDQQETTNNYQQLIQNPPKNERTHMDKKSFIQQSSSKVQKIEKEESQNDRKSQDGEALESVTDKWITILSLVGNGELNEAFEQALALDDPIYLIRLLIITKTPISSLTADNCTQLWHKFIDIYKHNFISILFANDLNLIKNSLTIQEMHDLLLKIYEVSGTSKGKLSFNAALLYNSIDQGLRTSKNQ